MLTDQPINPLTHLLTKLPTHKLTEQLIGLAGRVVGRLCSKWIGGLMGRFLGLLVGSVSGRSGQSRRRIRRMGGGLSVGW